MGYKNLELLKQQILNNFEFFQLDLDVDDDFEDSEDFNYDEYDDDVEEYEDDVKR